MAYEEFDGELDAQPAGGFVEFEGDLDDTSRRELPAGVRPSAEGAGRGAVNPPLAADAPARRNPLRDVKPYVAQPQPQVGSTADLGPAIVEGVKDMAGKAWRAVTSSPQDLMAPKPTGSVLDRPAPPDVQEISRRQYEQQPVDLRAPKPDFSGPTGEWRAMPEERGSLPQDIGIAFTKSINALRKTPLQLADILINADRASRERQMAGNDPAKLAEAERRIASPDFDNHPLRTVLSHFENVDETLQKQYSTEATQQFERLKHANSAFDAIGKAATGRAGPLMAIESLGTSLTAGGLGMKAGQAMAATPWFQAGGQKVAQRAADAVLRRGGTQQAAQLASQQAATIYQMLPGAAAMAGADFVLDGVPAYEETLAEVSALPEEAFARSQAYQDLRKQGLDHTMAARLVAKEAASRAFLMSGGLSALASPLNAGMEMRAASRAFTRQALDIAENLNPRDARRVALSLIDPDSLPTAMALEFAQEAAQSGGAKLGQNLAQQQTVDPEKDVTQGVAAEAGVGGVVGALMGGAMKGGTQLAERVEQRGVPRETSPSVEPVLGLLEEPQPVGEASPGAPTQDVQDVQDVQVVQEQPQPAGDAGAAAPPVPAPAGDFSGLAGDEGPADTSTLIATPLDEAAHAAATSPTNDRPEPTDAQKEAGNYAKGHVRISGMDVSIENPKGSPRRSKADAQEQWEVTMPAHYGYIRGTTGADGDHVDLFIGDRGDNGRFWVINQHHADQPEKFDEHKVITGVDSAEEAVALYKASFADGFGDKVFTSVSGEVDAPTLKGMLPDLEKPKPVEAADVPEPDVPAAAAVPAGAPDGGRGDGGGGLGDVGPEPAVTDGVDGDPAPPAPDGGAPAAVQDGRAGDVQRVIARVGVAPAQAQPLELRTNPDGTMTPWFEGYEVLDYDSGDPVRLPAGTSDADAIEAVKTAGSMGKVRFFPAAAPAPAPAAAAPVTTPAAASLVFQRNDDGTLLVLGEPSKIKEALPGIPGIAGKRGVTYGRTKVKAVLKAMEDARAAAPVAPPAVDDLPEFRSYEDMSPEEKAAFDKRQGIEPGRREEVAATLERIERQNEETRAALAGTKLGEAASTVIFAPSDGAKNLKKRAERPAKKAKVKPADDGVKFSVAGGGTAHATDSPAFKRWFGDSKVVDTEGKPMVMYHGTTGNFDKFSTRKTGQYDFGEYGRGFYFSPSGETAGLYADLPGRTAGGSSNVMPVYLSLQNPAPIERLQGPRTEQESKDLTRQLKRAGHDGVLVYEGGELVEAVAFRPEQIKSAIGNRGTFDPNDSDIRFTQPEASGKLSRTDLADPRRLTPSATHEPDPDPAVQRIVADFERRIAKSRRGFRLASVAGSDVSAGLRGARALARGVFGHQVIFVHQPSGRLFNGAVGDAPGQDVVFIDVDSDKPAMAVLGHELLHRMRATRPDLYDGLRDRLLPIIKRQTAYNIQLSDRRDKADLVALTDDALQEELIADVVGDEFAQPEFWRTLAGKDRSWFRRVADFVMAFFDDLIDKIKRKRPFGTEQYLSDIQAARAAVADVMAEFSAGEVGTASRADDGPRYSLANKTPDQRAALERAGLGGPRKTSEKLRTYLDRALGFIANRNALAAEVRQGALDQFHGIDQAIRRDLGPLPVEQDPYIAARLANGGTSSVMRALLLHGQAMWAANGQHLDKKPGTKGLLEILAPLGDDLNDWFGWMIGNRAARLATEGRENNFTAAQIKALQDLPGPRLAEFQKAAAQYAEFKRSVLDVAQAAGLIDPEGRKAWDYADYIPFYRQIDERASFSPTGRKGLAGQSSGIRTLKGGENALNDPMENLLMNFSRLIDASLKNNALRKTIEALKDTDVVKKVGYDFTGVVVPRGQIEKELEDAGTPPQVLAVIPPEAFEGMAKMWAIKAPTDPDVVRVMVGGKPQFYKVNDPLLLRALTSFVPFDFPGLGVMRAFKRLLTATVTATPEFMLRNFTRDTMAAQMIARDGFNPAKSLAGIVKSYSEGGGFESMLFAGASFQSGNINAADPTGTAVAMRRALRSKGLNGASADSFMATVLDTPAKFWEKYRQVGEAIENANREAVYEAAMKRTVIHNGVRQDMRTAAAYEAKDLMDFTLRGSWAGYQLLADVLPFFNARVQGLYRLGRSDPKRLAAYGMLLAAASMALALGNAGEDWYEELPDWDKDNFWHFKIGQHHWRLPKPFELGVVFATIPERIMRYIKEYDRGSKTAGRLWANVRDQLAFDPVPQMIRPALNAWANKDTFRDSPIEGMADEGKLPHARYSASTSATARVALDNKVVGPAADAIGLSPKKLEYLVGGYLGTAGLYALGLADMAVKRMEGRPPGPALRADDLPVVKAFYRVDPARGTVFESDLYKMREDVEQIYRTLNAYQREGDAEKAREFAADNMAKLGVRRAVVDTAATLARMNKLRDQIIADPNLTPQQKREKLDELQRKKNEAAKKTATHPAVTAAF